MTRAASGGAEAALAQVQSDGTPPADRHPAAARTRWIDVILPAALVMAQVLDTVSTYLVLHRGGVERNPIVADILDGGVPLAVGVKAMVTLVLLVVYAIGIRNAPRATRSMYAALVFWLLAVGIHNLDLAVKAP